MRLLHPKTIQYIIKADDSVFENATVSRKQVLSHVWSECFKYLASKKSHPKMFLGDEYDLYYYMRYVYNNIKDIVNISKKSKDKVDKALENVFGGDEEFKEFFDEYYLFSDLVSLYFKGINLFPMKFPYTWRRYVPVESLKEIKRQVDKTLLKK
jgi:hypothetical protein